MARGWHSRRGGRSLTHGGDGSQLGPTVRSARRNHRIVAKPRTRRGSVFMSGPDGSIARRRSSSNPRCRWPPRRSPARTAPGRPGRPRCHDGTHAPCCRRSCPDLATPRSDSPRSLTERRYCPKGTNHRLEVVGHAAHDAKRDVPNGRGRRVRSGRQSPGHVPGSGSSVLAEAP